MGQALSKHPVREVAGGSAVIAALCWWLEKEVNLPHNPHLRPKPKIRAAADKDALPVEGRAMGRANVSFASLQRLERLQRAVELRRSVPRSFGMAAKSFAKCFVAIGVLDALMARRSKA